MRLHRILPVILLSTLLALALLRLVFSSWSQAQAFTGCPASSEATGEIDPTQTVAFWHNQPIVPLTGLTEMLTANDKQVLGTTTGEKRIEIDLSDQKLTAYQGEEVIVETPVSTGSWGRTPVGEYHIWYKIRSTKMEGGNRSNNTYYYLPNVPYTMFFAGDIGIHGTYWHQNFGTPMSHGCVNTPTPVAEKLFYWADPQLPEGKWLVRADAQNPGTRVVVHE